MSHLKFFFTTEIDLTHVLARRIDLTASFLTQDTLTLSSIGFDDADACIAACSEFMSGLNDLINSAGTEKDSFLVYQQSPALTSSAPDDVAYYGEFDECTLAEFRLSDASEGLIIKSCITVFEIDETVH